MAEVQQGGRIVIIDDGDEEADVDDIESSEQMSRRPGGAESVAFEELRLWRQPLWPGELIAGDIEAAEAGGWGRQVPVELEKPDACSGPDIRYCQFPVDSRDRGVQHVSKGF